MKNKKKNKFLLLLILLLGITIGYAALSTTLKINGTASINKNTWSVYWSNVQVTEGSVNALTNIPTIGEDNGDPSNTKVTWTTTLNLPGDFYEFTVDATNNGTVDAMITGIDNAPPEGLPAYISYTVSYADGLPIEENNLLAKKVGDTPTTDKYKVRVEFLDTITPAQMNAIPSNGLSYTFTFGVNYAQATSAARHHEYLSMGNSIYGYENRFQAADWTPRTSLSYVTDNSIMVANKPLFGDSSIYSNFSRQLPDDYSFSGRMTVNLTKDSSNMDNAMNLVFSNEKNSIAKSVTIQIDVAPSSNHYWKDAYGQGPANDPDGWYSGTEPYPVGVSVNINGEYMHDMALVAHNTIYDSPYAHEIWYNYNGTEKKLYLYIADYDENNNVVKPSQPDIAVPIDMSEIFEGSHTMYLYFNADGGWDPATFELYGFEFNPYSVN